MGNGALTDLYEADPTEFVATRDRLVKQLRTDGKREEASALKARRRPSVAAWALNQVARHHPAAISGLLDAFDRAHTAQDEAVAGGRHDGLRAALADRRAALRTVTRHAAEVVEASGRSPDATVREIEAALQRTLPDDFVEAMRAGELSDVDTVSEGDGEDLGDLLSASVGLQGGVATEEPEPEPPKPSKRERERERERRRKLEGRVADREAELRDAHAALEHAQVAVEKAQRALDKAQRALDAARAELVDLPDQRG